MLSGAKPTPFRRLHLRVNAIRCNAAAAAPPPLFIPAGSARTSACSTGLDGQDPVADAQALQPQTALSPGRALLQHRVVMAGLAPDHAAKRHDSHRNSLPIGERIAELASPAHPAPRRLVARANLIQNALAPASWLPRSPCNKAPPRPATFTGCVEIPAAAHVMGLSSGHSQPSAVSCACPRSQDHRPRAHHLGLRRIGQQYQLRQSQRRQDLRAKPVLPHRLGRYRILGHQLHRRVAQKNQNAAPLVRDHRIASPNSPVRPGPPVPRHPASDPAHASAPAPDRRRRYRL